MTSAIPCSLLLCIAPPHSTAQILRVDDDAPPGGDGSSWTTAIDDLQLALGRALPGTEIWVAEGRYRPSPSDPTISFFLPDGVLVYGGFDATETSRDQRDPAANLTLLDGDLNGDDLPDFGNFADNALHVVLAGGGQQRAHLDGFTVRGGRSGGGGITIQAGEVVLANLILRENQASGGRNEGGGALLRAGRISVSDCTFAGNRATGGAGLALREAGQVLVSRCTFERNHANGGASILASGVAIGTIKVVDCVFRENTGTDGGGIYVSPEVFDVLSVDRCTFERNTVTTGAGVNVAGEVPGFVSVTNSVFRDNRATAGGGIAIAAQESADVLVSGCRFEGNEACAGGGLYLHASTVEVVACEFRENRRPPDCGLGTGGGAIRTDTGTASVEITRSLFLDSDHGLLWGERGSELRAVLSTFVNADNESPAIRLAGSTRLELDSCIVWGSADAQVDASLRAVLTAVYSDVRMDGAVLPGVGNIEIDPAFVDPATGNLRLAADSPCIDAGDPALVLAASDLDRDSRLLDGDLDGRVVTDMGADEFAALHLEILGRPLPGNTLTLVSTGPAGLQAFLLVSTPGLHHLPAVGTLFLDPASPLLRVLPWSTPSTVSVVVPPGVRNGLFHFQELDLGTGVRLLSNYEPLQF